MAGRLVFKGRKGLYQINDNSSTETLIIDASDGSIRGDIQATAGSIGTTELANDGVTYAKMQNVSATNRLLGRSTSGAGDVEEITVGGDISQSGSTFTIQNNTITAGKMQNGAITPAKLAASEALTATADGLTTGLMSGDTSHAVVTSAAATNAITLPASSSALIGKTFTIWVGANGFELLTPASSNATINGTDSDGTNQADIPANSLSRLTLVTTNTWILENIGSTGTVAAAIVPDND